MISFACKQIELKDLIKCSFEMNKTDYNLFIFLLTSKENLTTNEIAKKIGLDRTSVQKSIKRLVEKTLVIRNQENLKRGGYVFSYKIKDKDIIKNQVLDMISGWNKKVKSEVKKW